MRAGAATTIARRSDADRRRAVADQRRHADPRPARALLRDLVAERDAQRNVRRQEPAERRERVEQRVARRAQHAVRVEEQRRAEPLLFVGQAAERREVVTARSVSRTSSSRDCRSSLRSRWYDQIAKTTAGTTKKPNSANVSRAR